jgi:tetratricopeptide (TPR) repeat protein
MRLIDLPPHGGVQPEWLPSWVESMGGNRLNERGGWEGVGRGEQMAAKSEILASSQTDRYTAWAQWIVADSVTRPMAPESTWSRAQYVNHLTHSGQERDLQEALRLVPGHALAHARLGYLLARSEALDRTEKPPHRRHWMDSAQSHLRRAIELNGESAEVWTCQAEVYSRRGEAGNAREAAQRAVSLSANSAKAQYLDAVTAAEGGDWDLARHLSRLRIRRGRKASGGLAHLQPHRCQ